MMTVLEQYETRLRDLCAKAKQDGLLLSIELVPLQPLAMGNLAMRPAVREARKVAPEKKFLFYEDKYVAKLAAFEHYYDKAKGASVLEGILEKDEPPQNILRILQIWPDACVEIAGSVFVVVNKKCSFVRYEEHKAKWQLRPALPV